MKNRVFGVLAFLVAFAVLEVGSFVVLSLSAGELLSYADLRALRESRRDTEVLSDQPQDQPEDWHEHRIVNPQALHPFVGYVPSPVGHPSAESPRFSRQAIDYGFPLNTVDLFRPVADDEVVIGVFGGSFAAQLAGGGKRLANHLRRYSDRLAGKRVTVLSFAIAGYKQPQQLMALSYLLALGVHLDVAVNVDGFNEIALPPTTNIPKHYFPFYPRGWLLMVDDLDQDLRRALGELTFLKQRRSERAALFSRAPLRYSMAAGIVWRILDGRLTRRISRAEMALLTQERSASAIYQARGPRREYASDKEMFDDLVAVWKRTSLLMHGICRSRGIEYFHFLQPNQYFPDSKPLTAQERTAAWDDGHPYKLAVEKAYPLLVATVEQLRREGVPAFDLTMAFENVEETLYADTCCHLNRKGYALIAEKIAAALDGTR